MAARKSKKDDVIVIEEIYVLHNLGNAFSGSKTGTAICGFSGTEQGIPTLRDECIKAATSRLKADILVYLKRGTPLTAFERKWFVTNFMLTRKELYSYDCVDFGKNLLMYECDATIVNAKEGDPSYEDLMKVAYADARKELDILHDKMKKPSKKVTKSKQPKPETSAEK